MKKKGRQIMKFAKRLSAFALSALLAVSPIVMTSCNRTEDFYSVMVKIIPDSKEKIETVDDSMNGYIIVRGDSTGIEELNISKDIRDAFHELGFTDAEIKTDYVLKDNPPAKEIIVGTTNRAETLGADGLSDKDFAIKGTEHKIAIAAANTEALAAAGKYFSEEFLPKLASGEIKCGDIDFKYVHEYPVGSVYVGDIPLSECAAVLGRELSPEEKSAVFELADIIYTASGIRLEIIDEGIESEKRGFIFFGGSSSYKDAAKLSENSYVLKSVENGFVCASTSRRGIIHAASYIADKFFFGGAESFKADKVVIEMTDPYVESIESSEIVSDNANSLAEIMSVSEKTEICGMKVDGLVEPLGLDNDTPAFTWYMKSPIRGEKQKSFRVVVSSSLEKLEGGDYDIWDSGEVNTSDNFVSLALPTPEDDKKSGDDDEAAEPEKLMSPSTRYFWRVVLGTEKSGVISSEPSYFETGLLENALSDAVWIGADSYYCAKTAGTVEAKFTFGENAAGVSFGINESEDFYYMWQFNTQNRGYAVLRPHIYNAGNWEYLPEVSLEKLFPTAEDAKKSPITMKIDINEGVIKTYINGELVSTNHQEPFAIGNAKKRLSGGESAEYEYVRIIDESGAVLSDGEKASSSAPIYRRDFTVNGSVASARLYASALGAYEVYLNGERLGNSYLNPGRTQYSEKIYYQTYDVTSLIGDKNALAAVVGDGWYNSAIVGGSYGDKNAFIAKLVITLANGSTEIIVTDGKWQYTLDGPVLSADFYGGEKYDARLEDKTFALYGGGSDWQNAKAYPLPSSLMSGDFSPGKLTAETVEPVRIIENFSPVAVTNPAENVYIYDFGQNMAGTVTIKAKGESGKTIILDYGEYLNSNEPHDLVTSYMLEHNGTDTYTFRGGENSESFTPSLVYHGFRYLRVDGLSEPLPTESVTAHMLSTDVRRTGWFESSDKILNYYYENTLMSQRSNFVSNLTDCPTREKNGWTGDAQIFAKTASFNGGVKKVYENFMEMLRDSMSSGGAVPEILPSRGTSNNTKTPSGWSDAVITIPYELYLQYGDKELLIDNYDAMKKWIAYLLRFEFVPDKEDYVRRDGNYGDHLAYFNNIEGKGYAESEYGSSSSGKTVWRETSYSEIGTAYTAYSTRLLSKIASILGNAEDEKYYAELSGKFAKAWRDNFLEEDGVSSKANSQTSYVMGIRFGLYETSEKEKSALEKLCGLIESQGNVQTVGFIGMSYLYNVLSDGGKTELAYKLLMNTGTPSLLYPVTQGATTTWESYSGGSHNHYVSGSPVRWLYTDILGIDHNEKAENAGYSHFDLEPRVGGGLEFAEGGYESANGVIKSSWRLTDESFIYECVVPANTSATLILPKCGFSSVYESGNPMSAVSGEGVSVTSDSESTTILELESGNYFFEVK